MKVESEIREGDVAALDRAVLLSLRNPADRSDPLGPRWLEEMGRDFTALGGTGLLTLVTLMGVGYLFLGRKPRSALYVAASIISATVLELVLKELFARPRPALVPHLSHVISPSFPSGHSMLAAAVYLTLGALLARVEKRLIVKAYVLAWALLLAVLVGVSRVYLGVHWPTDVLAGWAAGAAWAALSWLLARALQRRGTLESTLHDG
ncbi:MAG: phosphatase PAP2 family protein [Sandaracinaceae bacterium]|nr:phosphatase PAP2 family protein [Sandaracinaceae bacterium]